MEERLRHVQKRSAAQRQANWCGSPFETATCSKAKRSGASSQLVRGKLLEVTHGPADAGIHGGIDDGKFDIFIDCINRDDGLDAGIDIGYQGADLEGSSG